MATDTVVVPPGHKIIVIMPTVTAHVAVASSGLVIVDYGESSDWRQTNSQLEAVLAKHSVPTVVIFQSAMIDELTRLNELSEFFSYWKASRAEGIEAAWVLPLRAAERTFIISSIRDAGYGVHASAPDGACFVEVHKPDGSIIIAMPGPALWQTPNTVH